MTFLLDDLEKVLLIFNLIREFTFWHIVTGLLVFIFFLLLVWGFGSLTQTRMTKGGR